MNKKTKTMKAWAVLAMGKRIVEGKESYNHQDRADELCIYKTKGQAEAVYCHGLDKIVPVTITYHA